MKKIKYKKVKCPYCGSTAVIREGSYVYGEKSWTKLLYVCSQYPKCDSYVGVHENTKEPKGSLANSELRGRRIEAHKVFDAIWKQGIMDRNSAYKWLCDKFGMNRSQAHIGKFSEYMCNRVIDECNKVLCNNTVA